MLASLPNSLCDNDSSTSTDDFIADWQTRAQTDPDRLLLQWLEAILTQDPNLCSQIIRYQQTNPQWGQLAAGMLLAYHGYCEEAYRLLNEVDVAQLPHIAALYHRWHQLLCVARIRPEDFDKIALYRLGLALLSHKPTWLGHHVLLVAMANMLNEIDRDIYRFRITLSLTALQQQDPPLAQTFAWLDEAQLLLVQDQFPVLAQVTNAYFAQQGDTRYPMTQGFMYWYRAIAHKFRYQLQDAEDDLNHAYTIFETIHHPYYMARMLLDRIAVFDMQGDSYHAGQVIQQLQPLVDAHPLADQTANILYTIGNVQMQQADYQSAATSYERAYAIASANSFDWLMLAIRLSQAIAASHLGDFASALAYLEEVTEVPNGLLIYDAISRGFTYASFGYAAVATRQFTRAVDVAGKTDNNISELIRLYLAKLAIEYGDPVKAKEHLRTAKENMPPVVVNWKIAAQYHRVKADLHHMEGETNQALAQYRVSIQIAKSHELSSEQQETEAHLANYYLETGRIDQAESLLDMLLTSENQTIRWQAMIMRAAIYRLRGQVKAGFDLSRDALRSVRQARRGLQEGHHAGAFTRRFETLYQDALTQATDVGSLLDKLEISELYAGQILLMRQQNAPDIQDLDIQALLSTVRESLQTTLGTDWTILRYVWTEQERGVFVITPDTVVYESIVFKLQEAIALDVELLTETDETFRYRAFLQNDNHQTWERSLTSRQRVGRMLLPETVTERLAPDHTLIIVPSDKLFGLPFHTLFIDDQPLITQTRVHYAQSLTLLASSLVEETHPTSLKRGLLLGYTQFAEPFKPLPEIANEISQIEELFPDADAYLDALTLDDLTELASAFDEYGWLHIATHGYIDDLTGTYLGLILGESVLPVESIEQWRLRARLVVVSACRSGAGKHYYGDDLVGLTQAFITAGAQSVIASQWIVLDAPQTIDLITDLYTGVQNGLTTSAALAEAQRKAIENEVDPFYWATFTSTGQP